MVSLQMLVSIPSGSRREFLQAIDMFSSRNNEPACTGRSVFQDVARPNRFFLVENWDDGAALDQYLNTAKFNALLGSVQVLGKLVTIQTTDLKPLAI